MDIYISDHRLRKAIGNEAACRRQYGAEMSKKLILRLAALRAAGSLGDFWPPKSGPERCHELMGELKGIFAIDLKQPYRLLFKPSVAPAATDRSDEQRRWNSITSIEILRIEDTHA